MPEIDTTGTTSQSREATLHDIVQTYTRDDPLLLDVLKTISVLRWFDGAILSLVLPEHLPRTSADMLATLTKLPFCQPYAVRGYTLSDFMRYYLLTQMEESERRRNHGCATTAYHQLLEALHLKPAQWFDSLDWIVLAAEWLYHLAVVDPQQCLRQLTRIFAEAFAVEVSARKEVQFCYALFNRVGFDQVEWPAESSYQDRIRYLQGKLEMLLAYRDKEALDLLEALAETPELADEQKAELYQWIGSTCFRDADLLGRARERLDAAHGLSPDNVLVNVQLAAFHTWTGLLSGRLDLACQYAERAISAASQDERGYNQLASICQTRYDWDGAIGWFEKARQAEPRSIDARLGLSEVLAARRRGVAENSLGSQSDVDRAIQLIDEAEAISPSIRYYALIRKGNAYRESWRFGEARQAYEAAKNEIPDRPDAYLGLGRLHFALLQTCEAEHSFCTARDKDLRGWEAYYELADLYEWQNKPGRAIGICRQAQAQGVESLQLRLKLQNLYSAQGRWKEVEQNWDEWLERDRGSAYLAHCSKGDALKSRAWRRLSAQDAEVFAQQAQLEYEQALAADPDLSLAWAHIGLAELALLRDRPGELIAHKQHVEDHAEWAIYDMLVRLGRAYLRLSSFDVARETLQAATGRIPQRPDAWLALTELYSALGNKESLLQAWQELVRVDPSFVYRSHIEIGNYYSDLADHARAREEYTLASREQPELAEADVCLAFLSKTENNPYEALSNFRRGMGKASGYKTVALAAISGIYLDIEQAEATARQAIISDPQQFGLNTDNLQKAEATARQAIISDPEQFDGYAALARFGIWLRRQAILEEARQGLTKIRPDLIAELDYTCAEEYRKARRFSRAEQAYLRCIEGSKANGQENARAYVGLAVTLVQRRKYSQAEQRFMQSLELHDPDGDFDACLQLGNAYEQIRRLRKAENIYRRAIKIAQQHPFGYLRLASVLRKRGRMDAARREYERCRSTAGITFRDLGVYYAGQDRAEDALECFHLALEHASDEEKAGLFYASGQLHAALDQLQDAKADFCQAIRLTPEQPDYYIDLLMLLLDHDEFDEAHHLFQDMARQPDLTYQAHLLFGNLLDQHKRLNEAEKIFRRAIRIDPAQNDGYVALAELLRNEDRLSDAVQVCRKMAKQPSLACDGYISIGNLLAQQKDVAGAEDAFRSAIRLAPERVDAYVQLAKMYQQQKRYGDAEQIIQQAPEQAPGDLEVTRLLAELNEQQGRKGKAIELYQRITEQDTDPDNLSAAYVDIGRLLIDMERYKEAQEPLQLAIQHSPTNEVASFYLGYAYECLEEYHDAEAIYIRTVDINPRSGPAYLGLGRIYGQLHQASKVGWVARRILSLELGAEEQYDARYVIAASYAEAGARKRAEAAYRELVQLDPKITRGYEELANWLVIWRKPTQAVEVLQLMAEQPELEYQATIATGNVLVQVQRYDEAEKAFKEAIRRAPDQPYAYVSLASMYRQREQIEEAQKTLRQALEVAQDNPDANELMAAICEQQGTQDSIEDSIRYYSRAAASDPDLEHASSTYEHTGDLLIRLGRVQEAREALGSSVRRNPSNPGAFYSLGWVHETLGDLDRAREMYTRATELAPKYGQAYIALGRVYGKIHQIQGVHEIARRINQMDLSSDERYDAHMVIATAYLEGDFSEWAVEELNKAVVLNPKRMDAYIVLGQIFEREERLASAIETYEKALQVKPDQDVAYRSLGWLYERQERWEDAIQVYTAMGEAVPWMASSSCLLVAAIYRQLGRTDEMYRACQKALTYPPEPNSPVYLDMIRRQGLAYLMIAEYRQAREFLSQASAGNPQDIQAHFYYALDLLCLGQHDEAWSELRIGIGLATNKEDYRYAIEEASALAKHEPVTPGVKEMLSELTAARDRA